jgi:thiamine biosynthesis lipoprotein
MNRRDFLRPRQLAWNAGQVLGALDVLPPPSPPEEISPPEFAVLRLSRRAMATTFEVLLPFGTANALAAGEAALDEIDRLEDQLTVYRSHSEVSRLNETAASQAVPVEENLFGLFQLAARISAETQGAFDVTAGPLIKAWGFFRRRGRVPSVPERMAVLQRVGMRHVSLDTEARTVRFARAGVEINLGSIGKGYALDRVANLLADRWQVQAALLHGGHSSVYALGSEPGSGQGWAVGIRHPWQPERRLGVVRLRDRALGTSAATFQHLEYDGRKLGHILDPRTGWPAEGVASVSVIAPTAAAADALATAFFVLGADRARAYCETHPDVGAVLLPHGEGAYPMLLGLAAGIVELTA